jgi:hypothetical protein
LEQFEILEVLAAGQEGVGEAAAGDRLERPDM